MTIFTGSEFEIKDSAMKFLKGENTAFKRIGCVGTFDETMNSKTVTKKCEGVVKKTRTRGDGTGELVLSLHMDYALFVETYGMMLDTLKEGVYAYGQNSRHKEFTFVARVLDEDANEKLKAYPNCMITSGIVRKIENGAEEVAEGELTIAVMPDDYGNGMYEAPVDEITDETVKTTWLTAFTPDLVKVTEA